MRKETFNRALVLSLAASMMASTTPLQPIKVKAASEEMQVKKNDTLALTLNYSTYTVKKGEKLKLKASISQPTEKNSKITWHTSDKNIVSVTQDGVITGVKKGKATITAKIDGTKVKAKCTVTVGTAVTGLTVKEKTQTVKEGNTFKLGATVTPSNASNKKLTYTSSDKTIATVSSSGVVTAKKPGKAVITIKTTDGSAKTAKVTVTVEETVTDLVITKNSLKNNKLTLTGGTYNNVTIENSVGSQAAIYFKNVKIKGNLILQDGVDYNVAVNMASNIANVICTSDVTGTQKEITKLSAEGKKSPIFKVKGSSIVGKIVVDKASSFALLSNKKATIKEIEVIHKANEKTNLSLTAYNGALKVQGAEKGELNVVLSQSTISNASIEGTATNQKVIFNATTTSTLKKIEANAPASQVIINGIHTNVSEVVTNAKQVFVSIMEKANVETLTIKGENTSAQVGKDSSIKKVDAQAKNGTIQGEGSVDNVAVSADGTKIETVGTKVKISNGIDGTIAGGIGLNGGAEITTGTNSSDSSASGNASGGSSSGGSSGGGSSSGGSSGGDTVWNPEFEAAVSALRKIFDDYAEPTKLLDGVTLEDIQKTQALVNKVPQIYRVNLQKKVDLAKEFLQKRILKEIEEAEQAIQIIFAEGDSETSVTSAFELPKTGLHGTKIIWESNSDAVVIKDGVVTIQRPLYVEGNQEVILRAIVQKDGVSSTTAVTKKVVILSVDKTALQGAIITIKEATTKEDIKRILENPDYAAALELNVTGFDSLVETEQDVVLQSIVDWETRKDFGIEIGSSLERAKRQFNQKWNALVSKEETDNQKENDSKDIQEALDLLDTYIFGETIPDDRVKELIESIPLPTNYGKDVSVQWVVEKAGTSQAKTGNFDNRGTVVRPDYSEGVDGLYTLTAICTKGIGEVENNKKVYSIVIKKAEANPEQKAIEAVKKANTKEAVREILENEEYVKVIGLDLSTYKNLSDTYKERIQTGLAEWKDKKDLGIEIGGTLVQAKAAVVEEFNRLVKIQVDDMGQADASQDIKDALAYVDKVIFGDKEIPENREKELEDSIVLPTISNKNVIITWSVQKMAGSAETGSFDETGKVIRPDYAKGVDGLYTLTATCTKEPGSVEPNTRTYKIRVKKKEPTVEQKAIEGIKSANQMQTVGEILNLSENAIALNLNMDTYAVYKRLDTTYQQAVQTGLADWEEKKDFGLELGTGQSLEQAREVVKTKFDELVKIQTDDIENKKANEAVQKALEYIENELLKTAEEKESRTKTVIKDILLPTTYEGVTITWTANKATNNNAETGSIDSTGTVVRPDYAGKEDAIYTLTATCTKELSTVEDNKKEFTIIITRKEASSIQNAIEKFTTAESIADMKSAIGNAELGLDVTNMKTSLGEDSSYYNAVLEALIKMDKTGLKLDENATFATKVVIQTEFNTQVKRQIEFKAVVDKANTSLEKAENIRNSFKDIYDKNEEKFTEVEKIAARKNLANLETAQKALNDIVKTEIENQSDIQAATNTLDEKIVNLEKNIDTLKIILVVADNLTLESLKTESDTSNIVDKTLQIVTAADLKLPRTIGEDKDKLEITWSSSDEKIIQTKTVSGEDVKYEHVIVNPKYTHNAKDGTIGSLTGEENIDDYTPVVLTAIVTSAIGGEAKAVNFNIGVREAKSNLNYIVDIGKGSLSVDGNAAINTKKDIISGTTTAEEEKAIVENLAKSQKIINVPNTTTVKEFVASLVISKEAKVTITKAGVALANDSTERLEASTDKYKVFVTPENGNELEKREYSVVVLKKAISKTQVAKAETANYESKKYVDNSTAIDMEFKEDGDNTIAITATDGLSASTEGSKKKMVGIVVDFADCVVNPTEITNLTEMKAEVLEDTKVVFWIEADNANGEEITQTIHYTVQFKDNDTLPLTFTYAPTEKTIGTQYVNSAIKNMNKEFFTAIFGAATADGYKVPLKNGEEEITNVTIPSAISGDLIQGEETATGELPVKLIWEFKEADGDGKATIKQNGEVVRPVYTDGDKKITVKIIVDYTGAIPGGNGQQQAIQKDMSIELVIEKTAATPAQTAVEEFNKLFADTPTIDEWNTYLTQYAEELGVQMKDTSNADGTIFGYTKLSDNYKQKVLDACVTDVKGNLPYDYTTANVEASKTTISTLINSKIDEQVKGKLKEDAQTYIDSLNYDTHIKPLNIDTGAEDSNKITKNMILPTAYEGATGIVYKITWTSSDTTIVQIKDGIAEVTRPAYEKGKTGSDVELIPKLTYKYSSVDYTIGTNNKIAITVLQEEAKPLQQAIIAVNELTDSQWDDFLTKYAEVLELKIEDVKSGEKITEYGYNSLTKYYKDEVKKAFIDAKKMNGDYNYTLTDSGDGTSNAEKSKEAIQKIFNVDAQYDAIRMAAQGYVNGLTYDGNIKGLTNNGEASDQITKNITLPTTDTDKTTGITYTIVWTSDNTDVISITDGTATVTRPTFNETTADAKVKLIPTLSIENYKDVAANTNIVKEAGIDDIEVTVLQAEATDEQKAILALKEAIQTPGTDNENIKKILDSAENQKTFGFTTVTDYNELIKSNEVETINAELLLYQTAVIKAIADIDTSKLDYTLDKIEASIELVRTTFDKQVTYEKELKETVKDALERKNIVNKNFTEMEKAAAYNNNTNVKDDSAYIGLTDKITELDTVISAAKNEITDKKSTVTEAIEAVEAYVTSTVTPYIDTQYVDGAEKKFGNGAIDLGYGENPDSNTGKDTADNVTGKFTLPLGDGIDGLNFTWASDKENVVIGGTPQEVTSIVRPKYIDNDVKVTLTVTIAKGGQSREVRKEITIKKQKGTKSQIAVEAINNAKDVGEIKTAIENADNRALYGITKEEYDKYAAFTDDDKIDTDTYQNIIQSIVKSGVSYELGLTKDESGTETEIAEGAAQIGVAFRNALTAIEQYNKGAEAQQAYIDTGVTSEQDSVYAAVKESCDKIGTYLKDTSTNNVANIATEIEKLNTAIANLEASTKAANNALEKVATLIVVGSNDALDTIKDTANLVLATDTNYETINAVLTLLHTSCGGTQTASTEENKDYYFETKSKILSEAIKVIKQKSNDKINTEVSALVQKNADTQDIEDFAAGFALEKLTKVTGIDIAIDDTSKEITTLNVKSEAIYSVDGSDSIKSAITSTLNAIKNYYNKQQQLDKQFKTIFAGTFNANITDKLETPLEKGDVSGLNEGQSYVGINEFDVAIGSSDVAPSTRAYYENALLAGKAFWNAKVQEQIENLFNNKRPDLDKIAAETTINNIREYKAKVNGEWSEAEGNNKVMVFYEEAENGDKVKEKLNDYLNTLTKLYCNRMLDNAYSARATMEKLVNGEIQEDGTIDWASGIESKKLSEIYAMIINAEKEVTNIMSGLNEEEVKEDIQNAYDEASQIDKDLNKKLNAAKETYDVNTMSQVKALYQSPEILPGLNDEKLRDALLAENVDKTIIDTLITDAGNVFGTTKDDAIAYANMALDIYTRTEKAKELLSKVATLVDVTVNPDSPDELITLKEDATFNSINAVVQEFKSAVDELKFTEKDKENAAGPTLIKAQQLWNDKVRELIAGVYDEVEGFKTQNKTTLNTVLEQASDVFTDTEVGNAPVVSPEDVKVEWNTKIYKDLEGLVNGITIIDGTITIGELKNPNIDGTTLLKILGQTNESGAFDVTIKIDNNNYDRVMLNEISEKILDLWKNTPQSTEYMVQQIADIIGADLDKIESDNNVTSEDKTPEVSEEENPEVTPTPEETLEPEEGNPEVDRKSVV